MTTAITDRPKAPGAGRWVNYADIEPTLAAAAAKRDAQKTGYASTRLWSRNSTHLLGLIGEWCFGLKIGSEPDLGLDAFGDDGSDFNGIDVKTSTYLRSPDLKVLPRDFEKGAWGFALVAVNEKKKEAAYLGWTTTSALRRAPLKDYGYGGRHALHWTELYHSIPPFFGWNPTKGVVNDDR